MSDVGEASDTELSESFLRTNSSGADIQTTWILNAEHVLSIEVSLWETCDVDGAPHQVLEVQGDSACTPRTSHAAPSALKGEMHQTFRGATVPSEHCSRTARQPARERGLESPHHAPPFLGSGSYLQGR